MVSVSGDERPEGDPALSPAVTRSQPPTFDPALSIRAVKYEYDMVVATASHMFGHKAKPRYSAAEEFALLESFLVHARNLHDFLKPRTNAALRERETRPRSQYSGSVWACDYVPEFGVETFDLETTAAINRWLQHVTTWRQEDEDHPGWRYLSMVHEVGKAMDEFLAADPGSEMKAAMTPTHRKAAELLAQADHGLDIRETDLGGSS